MKKSKLLLTSLFLTLALFFGNMSPTKVYADSDDPQGTSQKKAPPPQMSPELMRFIMFFLMSV
jgi:hypothetical protein